MPYRIIGDSGMDLPDYLKQDSHIKLVPLTLTVDDISIADDETFNQQEFIKKMKDSIKCPKSSCPSPEDFMKYFDFDGDIFIITLSSQLSGSYNSALLAKKLYLEENPHKNIEVIDSRSASIGETLIALKIKEFIEKSNPFEKVVKGINAFRDGMLTKFVIESLDNLRKNGRLSGIQAFIANALNIKPVMGSTPEGSICKLDQARGIIKSLILMAKLIEQDVIKPHERILAIAHCNNRERAELFKAEVMKRVAFKDCVIVVTAGISTLYANEGGIITAY
jgi:DegV family protein with EDD domain